MPQFGMLQVIFFATLCFEAQAAAGDIKLEECLDDKKAYSEEAVACDNKFPDAVCEKLFVASSEKAAEKGKDTPDRPKNCWTSDGSAKDDDLYKAAVDSCPKTCGLCCKTAAFDCEDDKSFDCDKVKKANQCKDPWKTQLNLADKCPKTCGLCDEKNAGCEDKEPNCDKEQCKNTDFEAAMKVNCKKTCGFCDETTTPATGATTPAGGATTVPQEPERITTTAPCGSDPRCAKWAQNGFCQNSLYSVEYKRKYCGKLCGLC